MVSHDFCKAIYSIYYKDVIVKPYNKTNIDKV